MSEIKKRFINIGTIGHVDHGKTTFTASVPKALSTKFPENKIISFDKIDKAPEERKRGITINATTITYCTDKTQFSHTDCPGHADYVKNMIIGATQLDAAILIVDANGADVQTREHILLTSKLQVDTFGVFVNKVDTLDPDDKDELIELLVDEVKDMLHAQGIKDENIIFGYGSALKALEGDNTELDNISNFIGKMDNLIKDPERAIDKPFKLAVGETFSITGRGTVVAGVVESGQLNVGDTVEIVRPTDDKKDAKTITTTVTGVEAFNKARESCKSGENVGLLLRGIEYSDISRGDIVCTPKTVTKYKGAQVEMYILKQEEGGRHKPFFPNYRPQFFIRTSDYTGSIHEISLGGKVAEMATPGDNCSVIVEFEKLVPIENEIKVVIREGGKTIAEGKITKVLSAEEVHRFIDKEEQKKEEDK